LAKIAAIVGLVVVATLIPVGVAVNRIASNPDLKLEE